MANARGYSRSPIKPCPHLHSGQRLILVAVRDRALDLRALITDDDVEASLQRTAFHLHAILQYVLAAKVRRLREPTLFDIRPKRVASIGNTVEFEGAVFVDFSPPKAPNLIFVNWL